MAKVTITSDKPGVAEVVINSEDYPIWGTPGPATDQAQNRLIRDVTNALATTLVSERDRHGG